MIFENITFKILTAKYTDSIFKLLKNNYIVKNNSARSVMTKEYIYWYMNQILPGHAIGLIYGSILIGFISAYIMDVVIKNGVLNTQLACVNYICIQKNLRECGLSKILITKLIKNLRTDGIVYVMYNSDIDTNYCSLDSSYCTKYIKSNEYVIPINLEKLMRLGFIDVNQPTINLTHNPLHIIKTQDLQQVMDKLNIFSQKYDIYRKFDIESFKSLMSVKNVIYSFVKKDDDAIDIITDFVSVRISIHECDNSQDYLIVAHLMWYFYNSMSMTNLIVLLIDKIKDYGVDHLVFHDIADNNCIEIDKYHMANNNHIIISDDDSHHYINKINNFNIAIL